MSAKCRPSAESVVRIQQWHVFRPAAIFSLGHVPDNINQAVEEHAFETYDKFIQEYGEELAQIPAPKVAQDYYRDGDLYMFDEMHTSNSCEPSRRRPTCDTLLDVFRNIRDDEAEHVVTMQHLQKTEIDISSVNSVDEETCVAFE